MADNSEIDDLLGDYGAVKRWKAILKISALGFVLIGLGLTQAVTGWMGRHSLLLKYIYPAALLAAGVAVLYCCVRAAQGKSLFPSECAELRRVRENATLEKLYAGKYGAFDLDKSLREDLISLWQKGHIVTSVPIHLFPPKGDELSDLVSVSPELAEYLNRRLADK